MKGLRWKDIDSHGLNLMVILQALCSRRNSIHVQCRTRIDTCFSLFPFQCTLPFISHTIHSDNFTMCPLTVHGVSTGASFKSRRVSLLKPFRLCDDNVCPSKHHVMIEIRTGQSDLAFSSLMLTWIEAAAFC